MSESGEHTHHHHHHEHSGHHHVDDTSMFREYMHKRGKKRKLVKFFLWYTGLAFAFLLALCIIFAYVIDN